MKVVIDANEHGYTVQLHMQDETLQSSWVATSTGSKFLSGVDWEDAPIPDSVFRAMSNIESAAFDLMTACRDGESE